MDGIRFGDPGALRDWVGRRRPTGLVEQARWLFQFGPLASLLVTLPGLVQIVTGPARWVVLLGAAALVACWTVRYRLRRALLVLDVAEVAVTVVLAATGPNSMMIANIVFAGFWFRSLYGSTARALLFCTMMATGFLTVQWVPALLNDLPLPLGGVTLVPSMFVNTLIARYLASALFSREQGQQRLAALAELGQHLIGMTDRAAIWEVGRNFVTTMVSSTPGLVVLIVWDRGQELEVTDPQGDTRHVPTHLPVSVLPCDRSAAGPVADPAALAGVARPGSIWVAVPPGEPTDPWIMVGGPPRVLGEVAAIIEAMVVQATLARRTGEAHRDLTVAATSDPLTGLANRGAFTAALEAALDDPQRQVALMFLDLDDFKLVNDGLGHAAGDELLRRVGQQMRECVRDSDLCSRLGGDEFAVMLMDADETAPAVAQRLVERVARPVSLGGRIAQVGASVGLAFSGRHDSPAAPHDTAEQLVQHADIAMYAAKAKGKNRVQVFDPTLLQDDGQHVFETELGAAAEAGQLVVHYQPIMSVADGRCHAVEALVRWQHPTRGLLGPAEFLAVAERGGAIVDIGAFVLWTACADVASWRGEHGRLTVHVNVSVAQLTHPDFQDTVARCVEAFAMEPGQLVLEITEGMVLHSVDVRAALQRLVEIGVAVAIDDFGTGYSALSTLRMLPLDIVKIDRSFLSGDPSDSADEAIVEAVVRMAGRLGLRVIGEGVERVDQQEFLERVGADACQGFLYLRPSPAPRFAAWLGRQAASAAPEDVPSVTTLRRTAR